MRVLDLFSGLGGFSEPFRDRGHDVTTLDIDARFEADIVADVRTIRYPSLSLNGEFDVVLASPPCQCFSTLTIARYWPGGTPTPEVVEAVGLVANALRLISEVRPRFWVLENPTAMLRTVIGRPKQYVHLCDWGANWRKRTDLWGRYPGRLPVPDPCAPHRAAPRGSNDGVMAVSSAEAAKLPYGLGEELCRRMEEAL